MFSIVPPTVWKNEGQQGLPISDILKCRQICSHWNFTIDKLFWEKFQFLEEPKDLVNTIQTIVTNDFAHSYEKLSKFLAHFENTHKGEPQLTRNPFICPTFSVTTKIVGDGQDIMDMYFIRGVSTLLDKYGTKIQVFSVKFCGDSEDLWDWEKS